MRRSTPCSRIRPALAATASPTSPSLQAAAPPRPCPAHPATTSPALANETKAVRRSCIIAVTLHEELLSARERAIERVDADQHARLFPIDRIGACGIDRFGW